MKSSSLLTFVTFSDVRMNLLFRLLEEPMDLEGLREYFGATSADIIPRLKELEKKSLIVKYNGKYCLTSSGAMMAKKLQKIARLSSLIDEHGHFFNDHDLKPIPEELQCRIHELGKCRLIENSLDNITATYREVFTNLSRSKSIKGISPMFDPEYPGFFLSMVQQNVPVSIILSENIYRKLETGYPDALRNYLSCKNASLYVTDEARMAFAVTDTFTSISLYHKNGTFDALTNLMSFDKKAVKWGEDLFEYHRQRSREIEQF